MAIQSYALTRLCPWTQVSHVLVARRLEFSKIWSHVDRTGGPARKPETGVIKWDPFWGNQTIQIYMAILSDFPELAIALLGLVI